MSVSIVGPSGQIQTAIYSLGENHSIQLNYREKLKLEEG